MTEDAMLRIGKLPGGRANLMRRSVMDDDGRVTQRVVRLVMKERRDSDRHRRKQDDEGGEWRETSAPEGASHQQTGYPETAKGVGADLKVGPYDGAPPGLR